MTAQQDWVTSSPSLHLVPFSTVPSAYLAPTPASQIRRLRLGACTRGARNKRGVRIGTNRNREGGWEGRNIEGGGVQRGGRDGGPGRGTHLNVPRPCLLLFLNSPSYTPPSAYLRPTPAPHVTPTRSAEGARRERKGRGQRGGAEGGTRGAGRREGGMALDAACT